MSRTPRLIPSVTLVLFLGAMTPWPAFAACDDPNPTHCPPPQVTCPPHCEGLSVPTTPAVAPIPPKTHLPPGLMLRFRELWILATRYLPLTASTGFFRNR